MVVLFRKATLVGFTLAGLTFGPSAAPTSAQQHADALATAPAPESDPCGNLWLLVGGRYVTGSLVSCRGSDPVTDGNIGGWVGDGLWPPSSPTFAKCKKGEPLTVVVPAQPDADVHLYLFEWNAGAPPGKSPRQLHHWRQPPSLRTSWACDFPEGRYLLTAYVHWPGVGTERSFGLEVTK